MKRLKVSNNVIRRLPRYLRKLDELTEQGVTRVSSRGGYSGEGNETLICAVSTRQMARLKEVVSSIDPGAFVIFTEVHDIMGDGFKMLY